MQYKNVLITGGAGFVGSNIAILLREQYPKLNITVIDNLSRRGSELNIPRFKKNNIAFVWGDVRKISDLDIKTDLIIECSAEPSVMAGVNSSPSYLIDTNLYGAVNCLEVARKNKADIIFFSTSRVYPVAEINSLPFKESKTRYEWDSVKGTGISKKGISEDFSLGKIRSMYGATKLCSEFLISEYIANYNIRGVINRCGVLTGPWQMGKIDQGVIMLWLAAHVFKKELSYIGFGGRGKQVRDILHVYDLFDLLKYQIEHIGELNGQIFNVGGGLKNSASLKEITSLCQDITGNKIPISKVASTRPGDLRIYITDNTKVTSATSWVPKRDVRQTLVDIYEWISENKDQLREVL